MYLLQNIDAIPGGLPGTTQLFLQCAGVEH